MLIRGFTEKFRAVKPSIETAIDDLQGIEKL
jgi:hypothetical protein